MISDTLISPRADYAIRNRSADFKKRTLSPDFRDILRKRCRERVKARRGALFDNLRSLHTEESMRNALSQFIEHDLQALQSSCVLNEIEEAEPMDVIENQPLSNLAASEREKWILEEYDRLIANTNAAVELATVVTCPMCARGILTADHLAHTITCTLCSLELPHRVTLVDLERLILSAVDSHSQFCSGNPQFTVCPDNFTNNLLLLCSMCSHLQQIV